MTALVAGMVLAALTVFWVLHPVVAGRSAPMHRDDEELTDAQHRKRMALYALRDVEYDYHAGKLDESDYRSMKREISSEALDALDAEEAEWAALEGRRRAREEAHARGETPARGDAPARREEPARGEARARDETPAAGTEAGGPDLDAVESEIAAIRQALREGVVCRECANPNPPGSRFCGVCGAALAAEEERGEGPSGPTGPSGTASADPPETP